MARGWIGEYECPECGLFDVIHEDPDSPPNTYCLWCRSEARLLRRRGEGTEAERPHTVVQKGDWNDPATWGGQPEEKP